MKNVLLTIALVLSVVSAKAQNQVYQLKEFYNFEIFGSLNPLTEYIENRELKLPGGQSDVTIEIDEKNHVVVVNNKYFNKVDAYPIIEKYDEIQGAVRYTVQGKRGPFIYVVTRQPDGNTNLYSFWSEGIMTKGWASVVIK
jgi:hypothetical protein